MDNLLLLDYDFSTTIEQFKKIDSLFKSIESAAGSFNFTSDNFFEYVKMFVTQLGKMFQALYNILLLPFYIIYDAYVFLRSIFDILCFYIGFTFPFYG